MRSVIPLAALTATLAVLIAAPVLSQTQAASSSASSASDASPPLASSSSSSPDCPAKAATPPQGPKPDPTARTTSSCFNPYVKQPGATASSSSSSLSH